MTAVRRTWLCACLAVVVFASGCGNGRLKVYPVTGQILVDGKPADGAFVVFHPQDGGKDAPRPSATTEADGTFRLTTYDTGDGAPAGTYRVTIVWRPRPKNHLEGDKPDRLKERYAVEANSKITANIEKAATNLEPFQLTQ